MPATPLFHPDDASSKHTGRLGRITKRETASLAALKQLVRKQGLNLGLVRGPGEQNDVCLLRFLRAQGFEEKRALASLVSCVEWGARVGLSGLRGHLGGGDESPGSVVPQTAEGLVSFGSGVDRQGRPVVILRLGGLTDKLVEACGRKALIRYFIWGAERVLERVAASMLSSQFIVEGIVIVCDAQGWNQETVGDGVFSFLQEAASLGLSYYPERLGQMLVVNVSPEDSENIILAARALGLGAAIDGGRLRVLSGDLPKWAPETQKAIAPEHLPVDYGGTAPALQLPPSDIPGKDNRVSPSSSTPGSMGKTLWWLLGGGETVFEIRGLHAVVLFLALWALHRESARLGEAALLGLALVLGARECVGGSAVTPPSAMLRVPLLHDLGVVVRAAAAWNSNKGSVCVGPAGDQDGDGTDGQGVARLSGSVVSLVGARVEIVKVVGTGQSGFDRFCIKVQSVQTPGGYGKTSDKWREWVRWRRLIEFVALRNSLLKAGYPRADGAELDPRTWQLPPAVHTDALARRLEAWLQRLLDGGNSADTEKIRIFLHEDESRSPLASRPRHPRPIQQQQQQRRPASTLYPADREAAADTDTQGPSTPSRIPGRPRRQTAPPKIVMSQLPAKAMSNAGASDSGVGRAAPSRTGSDSLWSGSRSVDETVWNGGGDSAAREIPSLRPELRSMFQDPGECHTLIVPEGEQNRWLKRANRAVAHFPSSNVTPSEAFFPTAASGSGERDGVGKSFSLGVNGFGGSNPSSPLRNRDRSASLLMGSPLRSKGNCGGDVGVPPWEAPSLDSKRGDPSPPRGKALGEGKEEQASPGRRREALKRFVSLMKRKGVKRGCPGDAALFRLLHVDVFQVPPDNHLHRVDHIVGLGGGRAQARVKQLTAKKPEGVEFLFVVNLQLPRSFTKSHSAASVVLYWGIPLEELSGSGVTAADPPKASSSKKPSFLSPSPSSIIPGLFERELLMRYIDLPFNRVNRDGPGVNVLKDDGGMGEGSNGALPGLSAVDDDDSESGVLPDKDFRNMSLKVVTSVVQGRWTVQKAVDEGNSQVLSRKLTQRYFRGSLYMETDVEIGSSVAAESVVGVCLTEPCILDVGFFLEGSSRILGCVRTRRVDLSLAEPLLLVASATQTSFALTPTVTAPPSPSDPSMTASTAMKTANGGGIGEGGMPLGNPQFASTWEDNGETHTFRVRGPGYLSGGGKVDAGKPFGRLVRADLFKMEAGVDRVDNVGSVGRAGKVVRRLQKGGEFLIIVNLQVPGNPPLSMVLYYAVPVPPGGEPQPGTDGRSQGFLDLFRRFVDLGPLNNSDEPDGSVLEGEMGLEEAGGGGRLPGDDLRNLRFKLLPSILEGPWIVRKAVGSKPTLIAQKLTCRYFRTRNYFEVDIDIGSSVVAYNTVSLAIGYAKSLVVDMGFCVQGEKEEELPEVLLGVARLKRLDVLLADNLEVNEEHEQDSDDEEEKADETGKNPQERKTGARLTELGDGAGGGGTSAGGKGGSNAAPGVSLSVVVPSEGDDSVAAEPSPIASPGLEDVFLDSGSDHIFRVRGSNYIVDGRKISAGQPFGTLLRADLFRIDGARHHLYRVDHICTHGKMKDRVEFLLSGSNPPFLFVVNIQMPGDRAHSVVLCWGMRLKEAEEAAVAGRLSREDSNFLNLFRRYIHLDLEGGLPINDIRNRRLKLFPRVLQGPWVVRKAIGKPCVIGRKLTARYFRRPGYFEVDIDVGSTALASNATHLAGGYAKNLVLDLGFALQGEAEDELPEKMIGSARIVRPDLGRAEALDW